MKQLLKKNQGTRIIVFTLMLTMLAWLAPVNVGVAKATDNLSMDTTQSKTLKVSSKKPLYKQCAGRAYVSKYKTGKEFAEVKFGKASKGKIKLYIGRGTNDSGDFSGTKELTGTVKGKTIKFKAKRWYAPDDMIDLVYVSKTNISGTITLVNKNTIKLKIKSGKQGKLLKPGKTITLRYNSNATKYNDFQWFY